MDEDPTSTLSFLYGTLSRPQNNSDRYEQVHFVDVKNKAKKKKEILIALFSNLYNIQTLNYSVFSHAKQKIHFGF